MCYFDFQQKLIALINFVNEIRLVKKIIFIYIDYLFKRIFLRKIFEFHEYTSLFS